MFSYIRSLGPVVIKDSSLVPFSDYTSPALKPKTM